MRACVLATLAALVVGCGTEKAINPPNPESGKFVVAGTVRDEDRAIAGARVTLDSVSPEIAAILSPDAKRAPPRARGGIDSENWGLNPSDNESRVTLTDSNGRFTFDQVDSGAYLLTVEAGDHLAAGQPVEVSGSPADTVRVEVALVPTGVLSGTCTLEDATSHENSIVYVAGTSIVTTTDAAGHYALRDVPVGIWTVTARHSGYLDQSVIGRLSSAGDSVVLAPMSLPPRRNIPPTAHAALSDPTNLRAGLPIGLNGTGTDPDGQIVLYEWDFEDDGSWDWSEPASGVVSHVYSTGNHRAKLRVTDNDGAVGVDAVTFTVTGWDTLFVSASTGSPAGDGSRGSPFSAISAGIAAASGLGSSSGVVLLVSADNYLESPRFSRRISVDGGYDPITWTRILGAYSDVDVGASPAVALSVDAPTTISGLSFHASAGASPSASAIAMVVLECNWDLRFLDCKFRAGRGADGAAGSDGSGGRVGEHGVNGGAGGCYFPSCQAGVGGDGGGFAGLCRYVVCGGGGGCGGCDGQGGRNGSPGAGDSGGAAGIGGSAGGDGGPGGPGGLGSQGANGTAPPADGIAGSTWTPRTGNSGNAGMGGSGGGGGGGGASAATAGGGGGGGGSGGGGGGGGIGGGGGGGSIAVYVYSGLYANGPRFERCEFIAGTGGNGGRGGNGALGGPGGAGGAGALNGGAGGLGGRGGPGGGGSGGPGGPSWCLYHALTVPTLLGNTYIAGAGGKGGLGGLAGDGGSQAATAPDGATGTVGP